MLVFLVFFLVFCHLWRQPTREDLVNIIHQMYCKDGFTQDNIAFIVDTFPNQGISPISISWQPTLDIQCNSVVSTALKMNGEMEDWIWSLRASRFRSSFSLRNEITVDMWEWIYSPGFLWCSSIKDIWCTYPEGNAHDHVPNLPWWTYPEGNAHDCVPNLPWCT